jgi:hypothetical protein
MLEGWEVKNWFWVAGLALLSFAVAQGAASLIVAGKKSALPWINVKNKVYIPLESLQKAGMVIKKTGSTYELSFPKPRQTALPVTAAAPVAPANVSVSPVQTATPVVNAPQVAAPVPASPSPTRSLADLGAALPQNVAPTFVKDPTALGLIDPKAVDAPIAVVPENPVVAPVAPASVQAPTPAPTPVPTPASAPVQAPVPIAPSTVGTVITVSSVNANTSSKPLLEGCSEQILNNGVWSAKLVAATNITVANRPGFAFIVEMTNLTRDTLSLFDAGFTDGEGGLSNFILVTADNRSYSARDTNPDFVYQSVGANQKLIFTLKFTFDVLPTSLPARLFLTLERRVPGYTLPDPSLRFKLNCK